MRIGIAVDSTCDLPDEYFREFGIHILPVTLRLGDTRVVDRRDPEQTLAFYREHVADRGIDAESEPFSTEAISELFLSQLIREYDYVFCITVTAERSLIFENATNASIAILRDYRAIREAAGIDGPFALRVIDSHTLFSGTGLLVAAAVDAIQAGCTANEIRLLLEGLAETSDAFLVPRDLYYIRKRASKKGEKTVNALQYLLAKAMNIRPIIRCRCAATEIIGRERGFNGASKRLFQYAVRNIEAGLRVPIVTVSYGGELEELKKIPGFRELETVAKANKVKLLCSLMSATAAVNTGEGALTLALSGTSEIDI